ncbi:hypothetical protein BP5796_13034 [Coleophoma crateriformis]|uniref:PEBP-like protein n=1 Tax=Coleophoma crateriformis TaxID=565419 RepID=A0A3D8Q5L2_9HELO|nr:hypothetical protein BP5796_13034 [Coleophoma crateriformis]
MEQTLLPTVLLAVLMIAKTVQGQTPPGLSPSTQTHLGLTFGKDIIPPRLGCPLTKADTTSAPLLTLHDVSRDSTYLAFMIDIDVLYQCSTTSLLHWYEPDLKPDIETGSLVASHRTTSARAEYGGPAPPLGTMHRYVSFLFAQPPDYVFPEQFMRFMAPTIPARLGFNLSQFVDAAGLDGPVAASYFTVEGSEGTDVAESRMSVTKSSCFRTQF